MNGGIQVRFTLVHHSRERLFEPKINKSMRCQTVSLQWASGIYEGQGPQLLATDITHKYSGYLLKCL